MTKGNINVSVENIFPLIKKFLYSDHEIFLRELISNATDATLKLKHLSNVGDAQIEFGNPKIEVKIDDKGKKIHIIDQGLGMTAEEVEKYINQVAFSGAEEFLDKYKDSAKDSGIIGHFGLGFYSAFMVADKVEVITRSHKKSVKAVKWTCHGDPAYDIENTTKKDRGTDIVLHISDDAVEYLEENKITELLDKYCKFLPIPVFFGTKTEYIDSPEGEKDDKGNVKRVAIDVPNQINNPSPAWTKAPVDLNQEDYDQFYRELYPMTFEQPLFHIHLNVDYPFNLTGILFFPKLKGDLNLQKDKIQLYQNQVYVTDHVEGIVPEFLTMLRGVIDSPDIPLNVSRSYLQADGAVKKISSYITKKVADKLSSLFKNDRADFESKWNDIKIVVEYGMLSEEKFMEKADGFALYPTIDGQFYTWTELEEKIKPNQTDKDGTFVLLYASDQDAQHSYIQAAKEKGYEVLLLDSPIVAHLMQKLETTKEKIHFARIDTDPIDKLIKKTDDTISKLSDEQKDTLKSKIEAVVASKEYAVQMEAMDSSAAPFMITEPEFMRRMKEMQQTGGGGGMFGMENMPEMYNLVVNTNNELIREILDTKTAKKQNRLIGQAFDLAKLSQNLLHGEELTKFIKRSYDMIK